MKNLFNDISQDEKNRILEMHSAKKNIISEQGIQQIPDFDAETQPNPTPIPGVIPPNPPKPKPSPKLDVNTPVNFYHDMAEKDLAITFNLKKPIVRDTKIRIDVDNKGRVGGRTRWFEFMCNDEPVVSLNGTNPPNSKQINFGKLYNLKYITQLRMEFCTRSRGGTWVPNVGGYSMNDTQDDTTNNLA